MKYISSNKKQNKSILFGIGTYNKEIDVNKLT